MSHKSEVKAASWVTYSLVRSSTLILLLVVSMIDHSQAHI